MRGGARTATVALTIAAVLLTAASVLGQGGTGVVAGRVIFDDTGEPMFGVEVKIEGTNFTTTTDRTGRYRLAPVPVGEQTVVVLAQGYTTQTTKVTVVAGEPVTVDARLSIAFAEAVEVTAPLLQGQARALTVQKNAANIVNVVSADDITALPDTNVAEAAGRIPGVSLTIDDGEGENMVVRGLPPQLNSVSINGERIPSTDTRNRNIDFVNTSSQILQSIEVTKAITPNMDADAIGGVVNLVTKQAPEEPILLVGFGGEYLDQSEAVNSEANFTWGQRFSGGANGFVLSGSYEDHDRTNQTRGDMEFDGDDLTQFILRGEESQAKRYSINGAFDHLSTDYTLFVRGTWSGREQTKIRRRERLRDVQRGIDGGKSGRIQWDIRDRERTVETGSFSLGGTNVLSDQWSTNWSASYNVGRREEPNTIQTIYRQSSATYTTPEFTGYDLYIFPTNLDYTKASLNQIQLLPISSKDEDITGRLDFKKALGTGGALEFGVKYRTKEKTNDEDTINYTGSGVPKYNAVIEPTVYHIYDDEYGVLGQFPNSRLGFDLIEQYGLTGRKDYTVDSADYTANEDVSAAYAQVEFTLAKNLMMLFGARYEYTASDYVGKEIIFNEDGDYQETLPITGDDSYSNVLPSLHLRWSLSDRTNLRLAATSSLARPVFYDIIPYQVIDQENDQLRPPVRALLHRGRRVQRGCLLQGHQGPDRLDPVRGGDRRRDVAGRAARQRPERDDQGVRGRLLEPVPLVAVAVGRLRRDGQLHLRGRRHDARRRPADPLLPAAGADCQLLDLLREGRLLGPDRLEVRRRLHRGVR
jgi:TonB-dependent receptor